MAIDYSLRQAKYDPFLLLPQFYQEQDLDIGNDGARMLMDSWQDQWFQLYDLINGIMSPAHDSWYAGTDTLPYIADLLNAPDLTAFNADSQNFMVWCWPAIRGEKGITRSVVSLSALLGYKVNVLPLWSAFALPNPVNLADASNNPYLSYTPAMPLATNGILNEDAAALRQQNGLWIIDTQDPTGATVIPLYGGETVIRLFNNPAFTQPTIGFTVFFPNDLTAYTVTDSTANTVTLDQPLKVPFKPISPGTQLPIFNPVIVYPSSFYDFQVIVDSAILDPTDIIAAFASKIKVLTDSVIPIRDRLRQILSTYQATASYTATCGIGLYGSPVSMSATFTSQYSYADALANAQLQAQYSAQAAIICLPEPPEVTILGIEPLAFRQFYSTATATVTCPANYYGPPSTVTVTRTSTLSQTDADQLAFAAAYGLAEASLVCTLNASPLITVGVISPTYSATVTYTAVCAFGQTGSPATVVETATSTVSYQDAESIALAAASAAANAALNCTIAGAPRIEVEGFRYLIQVGITETETCPAGQQGAPITISQLYSYQSDGEFQPTIDDAITLGSASAAATAAAQLQCTSDAGPTITIGSPTTVYSAIATVTESCASGINYQTGNVVTATYTGSDPSSYANAYIAAGSGAAATAYAALNCTTPSFAPDSILLVAKDEFGYDPVVQYDNSLLPFNSGNDYFVLGTSLGSSRSDFARFLQVDAPQLKAKGVSQIILEVDWFTPLTSKTLLQPYMSVNFAERILPTGSGNATWSVATYNPTNASLLPSPGAYRGGSPNDASVISAIQALNAAGFKVGINPIVRFIDTINSVLADRSTVGYDSTGDIAAFPTWLTAYNNFLQHYVALFQTAGVNPSIFYIGNGYKALTNDANLSQRRAFLQQLISSATTINAAFPSTIITYAARHDEYGWNSSVQDFPLDGLWTQPLITLGLNWFEPSGKGLTATWNTAQVGANSGEDMYYVYASLPDSNRLLNTTDHAGKTNAATTPIYPGVGQKNIASYLSNKNWHYVPPPSGYAAGATALPGNALNDAYGFSGLTLAPGAGSAYLESRFNWFAPRSYGVLPRPSSEWLTALNVSGGGYATAQIPQQIIIGNFDHATVEVDFKPDYGGAPPLNYYPTIASVPDGLGSIQWDGGYRKVFTSLTMESGPNWITPGVFADDDTITSYHVDVGYNPSGAGYSWTITEGYYQGGVLVSNTAQLPGQPVSPYSDGNFYLGAFSPGVQPFNGSIYRLELDAFNSTTPTVHYGGIFYFDEAYAGTRTDYVAEQVPFMLTELGVPSVDGGLVEPVFDPTPVPINPITNYIGDTAIEGSVDSGNSGLLIAQRGTLSTGGVLKYLSFYVTSSVGQLTLALYDATGTGGAPGNLIISIPAFSPSTGWNTISITPLFVPAGTYWLAYEVSDNAMTYQYQITSGTYYYLASAFGSFPAVFPGGYSSGIGTWSFYATVVSGATVALPSWLNATETAYLNSIIAAGYTFSDFHGPYGTDFKRNFLQQLFGCTANLAALKAAGFNKNLVAAEWDVRSPAAFLAKNAGAFIYGDGPLYPYRRVLNGKLTMGF